jgi:hypothetical protein
LFKKAAIRRLNHWRLLESMAFLGMGSYFLAGSKLKTLKSPRKYDFQPIPTNISRKFMPHPIVCGSLKSILENAIMVKISLEGKPQHIRKEPFSEKDSSRGARKLNVYR